MVPETARQCFEKEMARGCKIDEILENYPTLQRCINRMQLEVEHWLHASDAALLDRALPGSITFRRVFGLNPNEILSECFHHRYASVFILDRLPVQRSMPLGPEDDAAAGFLDEWLARDYDALGYRIVRVPVLPPKERLAFVLERLSELQLI